MEAPAPVVPERGRIPEIFSRGFEASDPAALHLMLFNPLALRIEMGWTKTLSGSNF